MTDIPKQIPYQQSTAGQLHATVVEYGFAKITGVFSGDEVTRLSDLINEIMVDPNIGADLVWRSSGMDGKGVVQRISRINLLSAAVSETFVHSRQLSIIGSQIFDTSVDRIHIADGRDGSDGIVLVVKDPRNVTDHKNLRWHRDDKFTCHLAINPFVNVGLYLDSSDASRGALIVIPRSHGGAFDYGVDETIVEVPEQVCVPAEPGDVIVHDAHLLHRSGPHYVQGQVRRVIYANLYTR